MSNEHDIMCIIWQSAGNDNTNCRIESTSDTCTCLFTTQNNILMKRGQWRQLHLRGRQQRAAAADRKLDPQVRPPSQGYACRLALLDPGGVYLNNLGL